MRLSSCAWAERMSASAWSWSRRVVLPRTIAPCRSKATDSGASGFAEATPALATPDRPAARPDPAGPGPALRRHVADIDEAFTDLAADAEGEVGLCPRLDHAGQRYQGTKSTISAVTALTRSAAPAGRLVRHAASRPRQISQAHEERKIDGPLRVELAVELIPRSSTSPVLRGRPGGGRPQRVVDHFRS